MSEWKESALEHKYTPLPEEPKYKKRKKKFSVKKSDHKHYYESCLFKTQIYSYTKGRKVLRMYGGTYCPICGRIGDIYIGAENIINNDIPLFDITETGLFTKKVNLGN